ncbi:hypothetical protein B0H14DRAFT_2632841 [Mycena olivaceomarginata]|nr:hypothetical protein B0H14DRAFT_2632841 [Mycena olivaceomarginata]
MVLAPAIRDRGGGRDATCAEAVNTALGRIDGGNAFRARSVGSTPALGSYTPIKSAVSWTGGGSAGSQPAAKNGQVTSQKGRAGGENVKYMNEVKMGSLGWDAGQNREGDASREAVGTVGNEWLPIPHRMQREERDAKHRDRCARLSKSNRGNEDGTQRDEDKYARIQLVHPKIYRRGARTEGRTGIDTQGGNARCRSHTISPPPAAFDSGGPGGTVEQYQARGNERECLKWRSEPVRGQGRGEEQRSGVTGEEGGQERVWKGRKMVAASRRAGLHRSWDGVRGR